MQLNKTTQVGEHALRECGEMFTKPGACDKRAYLMRSLRTGKARSTDCDILGGTRPDMLLTLWPIWHILPSGTLRIYPQPGMKGR